jgi:hypothetical protein
MGLDRPSTSNAAAKCAPPARAYQQSVDGRKLVTPARTAFLPRLRIDDLPERIIHGYYAPETATGAILPSVIRSKLPGYFRYLENHYRTFDTLLARLIAGCRVHLDENTHVDNWSDHPGHTVALFVPFDDYTSIPLNRFEDIRQTLLDDLRRVASGATEWIGAVRIELLDETDPECLRARQLSARAPVDPDALPFWKPGFVRAFISHRDSSKIEARDLSDELDGYGISCFVAHDTITPMSEWRSEILRALDTMEVMLVLLTDEFNESLWCHQEIGFAIGRGVPIIPLKTGRVDPPGFISHVQALRIQIAKPLSAARTVLPLVAANLQNEQRMVDMLVSAFVQSPSFTDAKIRFERLAVANRLSDANVQSIISGFATNSQLFGAVHLTSKYRRLLSFLERTTGKKFEQRGRQISEVTPAPLKAPDYDDVPF